jgi:hypothetical protein
VLHNMEHEMAGEIIHDDRTVHPSKEMPRMSAAQIAFEEADRTRELAKRLEHRVAARVGSLAGARPIVARDIGVSTGTLETLRRGRLKRIEGWLRDKIESVLMREIEAEIRRLNHELALYRQIGRTPRPGDLEEIEADLAALKAALKAAP